MTSSRSGTWHATSPDSSDHLYPSQMPSSSESPSIPCWRPPPTSRHSMYCLRFTHTWTDLYYVPQSLRSAPSPTCEVSQNPRSHTNTWGTCTIHGWDRHFGNRWIGITCTCLLSSPETSFISLKAWTGGQWRSHEGPRNTPKTRTSLHFLDRGLPRHFPIPSFYNRSTALPLPHVGYLQLRRGRLLPPCAVWLIWFRPTLMAVILLPRRDGVQLGCERRWITSWSFSNIGKSSLHLHRHKLIYL